MFKAEEGFFREEKQTSEVFKNNKKKRMEKFMIFFEEVKRRTDQIYKTTTKSDKNHVVGEVISFLWKTKGILLMGKSFIALFE